MQSRTDGGYGTGDALIVTRRLAMRKASAEDHRAIAVLAANPRLAAVLASAPGDGGGPSCARLAVSTREDGMVIGEGSWGAVGDRAGAVEIAVWIGEAHWGSGYTTEAAQALVDHVFRDERTQSVWSTSRASSARSRHVIEKCGFQYRGTGMVRGSSRGGAVPVERFVLERRTWQSLKAWGAVIQPGEDGHVSRHNAA